MDDVQGGPPDASHRLANKTQRLVELLCEAESRGYLLEDALTLVDTAFWLQMIDWKSTFVSVVLNCTKDPSRKILRPLMELFGRDRDRMRRHGPGAILGAAAFGSRSPVHRGKIRP